MLFSLIAYFLSGASLYLYTHYALKHHYPATILSSFTPLLAALLGTVLFHFPFVGIVLLSGVLVKTRFRITLFGIHALCCMAATTCFLVNDFHQYCTQKKLLQKQTHTIEGLIIEKRKKNHATLITLSLTHIGRQPAAGIITFFVYSQPKGEVGDYVRILNIILEREKNTLKTEAYMLRDHVLGTHFSPFLKLFILKKKTVSSRWIAWWAAWRSSVYTAAKSCLPPLAFSLYSSLFLGNKNNEEYLTSRISFTRWGLTHYLARSGLHISLLVSLWAGILHYIPLWRPIHATLLCGILFIYDQLSWRSISFNRALWLYFFYLGGWLVGAGATPLFGLCQLTLLILLTNPWQAGCLDFQLSFFLTMILLLLSYAKHQSFLLSSCIIKKK